MASARRGRLWIAAAALLLAACSSPEERLGRHLKRGEDYLEQGQTQEALLEFQNALKIQPENAALYERIGEVLFSRSQFAEALQYFQQAYHLDDSRIAAAMNQARLIAFEDPGHAHRLLRRGLKKAPELAIVHRTRAHIAVVDGDTATALRAAKKAVEIDPEDIANWVELGNVHQARIRRRQIQRRPPKDAIFEAAIEAFEHVDELQGGFPRARLEKARVLSSWPGHRLEAIETYDDALALAEQQQSPLEIRFAARAMEEYGRQIGDHAMRGRALRALVAVEDDDYEAWDDLGRLSEAIQDGAGESIFLKMLEKRPDDPRAHLVYTGYLIRNRRSDDAEAHLTRTLEDGLEAPLLWERLMQMKIQQGRLADARALYVRMSDEFPDAFETRRARARMTLGEGRAAQATRQLHSLITERESFELYRLLALAEHRLGDLTEARKAIERAMKLAPQPQFPVLRLKATIDYASGRWKAALETYRLLRGLRQELFDEEKVQRATALHRIGKRDASLELLEELLAADPPFAQAAIAYAELEGERNPERAHAQLVAAHEREPTDHPVLKALTEFELRSGRSQQALARLNRVVASRLAGAATLLMRAQILLLAGAYDQAEADVLRAFEADPTLPGATDLLFSIYQAQGRLEEARRSFEQAEEAGVLHSGARLLLGHLYLNDGDTARARQMFEQVVQAHPELWSAKHDLATVLAERGEDLDRALQLAREAHTASGRSPATADTVGYVHHAAGRYEPALQQFSRAIELARERSEPISPTFRYHLGLALRALGRDREAVRAFEQALGEGDFPGADDARRQLEAARHSESESESGTSS